MDTKVTTGTAGEVGAIAPDFSAELCERAPDGICVVEQRRGASDYVIRYVNRAFASIYECDRDAAVGMSADDFMRGRSTQDERERVNDSLAKDEPFRVRRGFTRPDGTFLWIEANFQQIPWDGGRRWMFITRDATREKLAHERMVQLTTAVEHGYDPVAVSSPADGKWSYTYVNDAFTRITGYLPTEVIGKTWDTIMGEGTDPAYFENVRAALFAGQQVRTELPYRTKDGRTGIFEIQIQPIREPSSGKYTSNVSVYRDITEARLREQKLRYEAEHDPLTGIYNRRFMERAIETAASMTRTAPVHALLFADLDGFKDVNDRLGHDTGDRVLVAASRAFGSSVFKTDVLGRWGGDEFAALLYHCSLANALLTAEEMIRAFAASPERHGTTVSVGVVAIKPGESMADLIRRADRLCYRAKAAGRNRVLTENQA